MTSEPEIYDLVLKGGRVVDLAQKFDGVADVAIRNGRIAALASTLPPHRAARTEAVAGSVVVPGVIDMHVHNFQWVTGHALNADQLGVHSGATTTVSMGDTGSLTLRGFKHYVVPQSKTHLLCVPTVMGAGFMNPTPDPHFFHPDTVDIDANIKLAREEPDNIALQDLSDKYKLKYDFKDFRSGTENILALEQREIDVSTATSQHLLRAIEEQIPIVWVIGWGGGYNVLVARAELGLAAGDYAGLKKLALERAAAGRRIKIAAPTGSMQHLLILTALQNAGIRADRDVEIVNIPFPTHPRAIESGEVDLAGTLALFGAMSITSGKGKLFHHMFGGTWGKQEIGFFVHRKLIEEKPDLVQRIVASHAEAIARVSEPGARYELEAKASRLPAPVLAMTEKEFLKVDYRTNLADVAIMAKRMHAAGWTKRDISGEIEKNVDFRFLEKATGKSKADLTQW